MQTQSKPTPKGLMGSINIDYIEDKLLAIHKQLQTFEEEMKRHANLEDMVAWTMTNEKKKKALQEREYLNHAKQGYFKQKTELAQKEAIKKQKEITDVKHLLFSENFKLRGNLQKIITSLIKEFKQIEELNIRRVDEIPDVTEAERLAFRPETYFHDFFRVLNSHSEASKFLSVASKMEYPPISRRVKMKDYNYEQTNY